MIYRQLHREIECQRVDIKIKKLEQDAMELWLNISIMIKKTLREGSISLKKRSLEEESEARTDVKSGSITHALPKSYTEKQAEAKCSSFHYESFPKCPMSLPRCLILESSL